MASEYKEYLLRNSDFPGGCTRHVKDPKLFTKDDCYYLILGTRLRNDAGYVLGYVSDDLESWKHVHYYVSAKDTGFTIECPGYLQLREETFFSCNSQGLRRQGYELYNVYDCGYYKISDWQLIGCQILDYRLDFYATQMFCSVGRSILVARIGMPDNAYVDHYETRNQTLTMSRPIFLDRRIIQKSIQEILDLRADRKLYTNDFTINRSCNIEQGVDSDSSLQTNAIRCVYRNHKFTLDLFVCNCNRQERCVTSIEICHVPVFADESTLEIFVNEDEYITISQFYDDEHNSHITSESIKQFVAYSMRGSNILWKNY